MPWLRPKFGVWSLDVNSKPPTQPLCKLLILPQAAHFSLASLQSLCLTPRGSRVLSCSLLILYAAMSLSVKPLTSRFCQSPPESRMDVFQHSPLQGNNGSCVKSFLKKSCHAAAVPHPHCHHATLQSVQCHRRSKDGIRTGDVAGFQTVPIHDIHCGCGSKLFCTSSTK